MVEAFLCVLYNDGTDKEVVNMLAENLALLRNLHGMTQEEVAEVIGISRQSYAKWEQGETIPDIEKCDRLAKFYGVSIDALIHQDEEVGKARVAPAPVGKHLWGTVAMGAKGADRHPQGRAGYLPPERRRSPGRSGRRGAGHRAHQGGGL